MAVIDDLKTARGNMAARLAEVTECPKPSYSVDGQAVSWTEYMEFLVSALERLDAQIADKEGSIGFHQTQGFT